MKVPYSSFQVHVGLQGIMQLELKITAVFMVVSILSIEDLDVSVTSVFLTEWNNNNNALNIRRK